MRNIRDAGESAESTASATRVLRRSPAALVLSLTMAAAICACQPHVPTAAHAGLASQPAVPIDSGWVAVAGGRLYYESAGRGSVIVLIHGGNLDRRMWDPQFRALAREHRVIRYDLRGFGRSQPTDSAYTATEDLLALLAALRVTRTSLVGLSLGGRIAIDFALTHPTMLDRLVLAAPGLSGWQFARGDTAWIVEARAARDRGDYSGVAVAWLESGYMRPAMGHASLAPRLREMASDNSPYWKQLLTRGDAEFIASPPALHRTTLIHAPTLLIVGARDVPDILQIADTLMATVPRIRRITFEHSGHMVNMEEPARFTSLVEVFLR